MKTSLAHQFWEWGGIGQMMTVSFRINKTKIILGLLAAVTVLAGAWGLSSMNSTAEVMTGASADQTISVKKGKTKTNKDRVAFIRQFGWEIEEEPTEIMEAVIPEQLDEVYEKYNAIQKEQGFDLSKYCGKKLKRYAYKVTNYPGQSEFVEVNLLIYQDTVVGGDVCSTTLDGFMHGLRMTQQKTTGESGSKETEKQ